ncbi:hypothetical protein [Rhodobacter sp. NSM]|uniref:hypothetical protein n=1 Tax=Rhodobacter sp. NSM TaxID=3457501 RepID=UPI003FD0179B
MSLTLIPLARKRRLRALRHLHREGLETRNVFAMDDASESDREPVTRDAWLSEIAMDAKHAKVVRMVR